METLTFQTPDEARAWDAIVTELVGCYEQPEDVLSRADAMLLERRKRMAHAAQIVAQESYNANSISPTWTDVEREWIPHKPGDPMPCDGYTQIEYKHRRGTELGPCLANQVAWDTGVYEYAQTVAWRPA